MPNGTAPATSIPARIGGGGIVNTPVKHIFNQAEICFCYVPHTCLPNILQNHYITFPTKLITSCTECSVSGWQECLVQKVHCESIPKADICTWHICNVNMPQVHVNYAALWVPKRNPLLYAQIIYGSKSVDSKIQWDGDQGNHRLICFEITPCKLATDEMVLEQSILLWAHQNKFLKYGTVMLYAAINYYNWLHVSGTTGCIHCFTVHATLAAILCCWWSCGEWLLPMCTVSERQSSLQCQMFDKAFAPFTQIYRMPRCIDFQCQEITTDWVWHSDREALNTMVLLVKQIMLCVKIEYEADTTA